MAHTKCNLVALLGALALTLASVDAAAQAQIVPEDEMKGASDKDVVGWNPALAVSGTVNVVNNTNVVGQVEGTSALFGLGAVGGADYINGKHVVRLTLSLNEGFAKTPVVDDFIKTNDELALESVYNYFLASKLGLYGRAKAATPLFPARAITADPVDYVINPAEMGGMVQTLTTDDLKVASAFKPFNLNYSAGGFAQPLSGEALTVLVRGGLGGRHTFASGVFVQNDDDATPTIEVQELADVHQLGAELFLGLSGKQQKGRLTYSAGASVLFPFVNNDDYDRATGELTRYALEATASVSVFDWMSVVYKGAIVVDPQLFPEDQELTQVQNSLLLTFQYTLIDRKKGLKELEKKAAAEREAKAKAEAERRAKEAEERAKQLQEELNRQKQLEKQRLEEQKRLEQQRKLEDQKKLNGQPEDGPPAAGQPTP
ncbi:MAG: hypothetical protein KJO07_00645 [Deltaproteobacteria bacterium]|nr:hypothetical protein [Deltaproteobacteria bacterium]